MKMCIQQHKIYNYKVYQQVITKELMQKQPL